MEQEHFTEASEEQKHFVNRVTPLSKYLAMTLFVALPFIGGYIGYTFAPEKVVEVERNIVTNIEQDNIDLPQANPVPQLNLKIKDYSGADGDILSDIFLTTGTEEIYLESARGCSDFTNATTGQIVLDTYTGAVKGVPIDSVSCFFAGMGYKFTILEEDDRYALYENESSTDFSDPEGMNQKYRFVLSVVKNETAETVGSLGPVLNITSSNKVYSEEYGLELSDQTVSLLTDDNTIELYTIKKGSCQIDTNYRSIEVELQRVQEMKPLVGPDEQIVSHVACAGIGQTFYELYMFKDLQENIKVIGFNIETGDEPNTSSPFYNVTVLYP